MEITAVEPTERIIPELNRVLVVEDEDEIRELIALRLRREGLLVDTVDTAEDAIRFCERVQYSLFVLDWMLPGASGIDITKHLRQSGKQNDPAILMVTAKSTVTDVVEGLEAGADDFLSKPFDPNVLLARARALLRRHHRTNDESSTPNDELKVVRAGCLALYPEIYEARCDGNTLSLTPSEFKLLLTLLNSRGRVLTRESLIAQVQGEGVTVVGRTVDTHVFGLRRKLGQCADVIETIRGVGYRIKPST